VLVSKKCRLIFDDNIGGWRTLMRGNDLGMKLLQDTQAQIVLACSKVSFFFLNLQPLMHSLSLPASCPQPL